MQVNTLLVQLNLNAHTSVPEALDSLDALETLIVKADPVSKPARLCAIVNPMSELAHQTCDKGGTMVILCACQIARRQTLQRVLGESAEFLWLEGAVNSLPQDTPHHEHSLCIA